MHLNGYAIGGVYEGGPRIMLVTSKWGRQLQTGIAFGWWWCAFGGVQGCFAAAMKGQLVINGYGWNEAKAHVPQLTSEPTYNQQFRCHVMGAYTPLSGGPSWDFEGWRANRPSWLWDGGAFRYKCNWPK
jgi:hypothetical protein